MAIRTLKLRKIAQESKCEFIQLGSMLCRTCYDIIQANLNEPNKIDLLTFQSSM